MKTSTIIRRLAALSYLQGNTTVFIPAFRGSSAFVSYLGKIDSARDEPVSFQSTKRYNHHKYCCCGKNNSSTSKFIDSDKSSVRSPEEIQARNYAVIYNRHFDRDFAWDEYLHLLNLLMKNLQEQLEQEPDNKRVAIEIKQLKRTIRDSHAAYRAYTFSLISPEMAPTEPMFECNYCEPNYEKLVQKRDYRDYDKRLTKSRRQARKNKADIRNFFLRQIELDEDVELLEEADEFVASYEAYSEACAELKQAEAALNLPCVEEAAWAIHRSEVENNPNLLIEKADIIAYADKILKDYQKALEHFYACEAIYFCPNDF
jgi:hypothetical protein